MQKTANQKEIMDGLFKEPQFKRYGQEIAKIVPKLLQTKINTLNHPKEELNYLQEAKSFFEQEFSCAFEIITAEKSDHPKAKTAFPGKAGVVVV